MRRKKKEYVQPLIDVIRCHSESMICSSTSVQENGGLRIDNSYDNGVEHVGGGEGNDI